jgi:hypothetical protein
MLSDVQITELCQRMLIPLADKKGIIFKSEINVKDLQYNKSYFINLDDEYDEKGKLNSGSHWTCFQIVKYPTGEIDPIYFDPFGIGAPEIIKESIMAFCKKKLPHTTKDIQSMLANACGWYCCAFLHFINNYPRRTGDVYDDTEIFLDYFDDLNKSCDFLKNEYTLKMFFQPKDKSLRRPITTLADVDFNEITEDLNAQIHTPFK